MTLEPGLHATIEETVTDAATASSLGSGDVPVLGTPWLVVLVERAAVAALAGRLADGETSVGTAVELRHLAPTVVGPRVAATARLTEVDGRALTFDCAVTDPAGDVARATHRRVVVDRAEFLRAARRRAG
jgi:fluoroacetyl-CoA thioesterase